MAYDLEITFRGMCFFVPDPERGCLHVLMPAVEGGAHGHPVDPHHARLSYPARQVDPDADPREMRTLALDGRELDLSGLDAGSAALELPPGVADLGRVAGLKMDPAQLGPAPRPSVAARLRLPAWEGAKAGPGGTWKWLFGSAAPSEMLTNQVTLTLPQRDDFLVVHLLPLSQGEPEPPVTLSPVDGVIRLEVSYLPDHEPEDPIEGEAAPHFHCHYALFEGAAVVAVPRLAARTNDDSGGGSPYTCLAAGGPPGP